MKNRDYEKKWLNDELSEEEKKDFAEEYQFLQKIQSALNQFKAPKYDVSNQERLLSEKLESDSARVVSWPTVLLRLAASILLVGSVYMIYLINEGSSSSPTMVSSAEKTNFILPDSSFVALNAGSKISYDWKNAREVKLSGEAFFHVKKGSTFDVITTLGTVSVVGTQFNVEVWDDFFEVICFEGEVRVNSGSDEISLTKGRSWRSIEGEKSLVKKSLEEIPDWRQGESRFTSIPLKYVFDELERQYNVRVFTEDIDLRQRFTGAFPHDNINLALKSISVPLNLSYKLEENEVQISVDQ